MIPVIDGHNDLAWARREANGYDVSAVDGPCPGLHTDLPRLTEGGVGGQFWSVWVDPVLEGAEQGQPIVVSDAGSSAARALVSVAERVQQAVRELATAT